LFQVHDLRVQVQVPMVQVRVLVLYSQVQVQVPVAQVLLRVLLTSTRVIVLIAKHTWARRTTVPLTYITLVRCGSAIAKVRYIATLYTEASSNPNGLNPNVTVGRMAIADPGYSGLTPLVQHIQPNYT